MLTDFDRATLLLSQAPTQTVTQQRLEAYLAASNQPNLDVSSHFQANGSPTTPTSLKSPFQAPPRSGTDTPRDLNSRIKILELYALHVLPRNGEWAYAREFVSMSSVLDDDAREEFLHTLSVLEDEQRLASVRERELQARAAAEERQRAAAQREEAQAQARTERSSQGSGPPRRPSMTSSAGGAAGSANGAVARRPPSSLATAPDKARSESERDYGIEDETPIPPSPSSQPHHQPPPANKPPGPSNLKGARDRSTRLGPHGRQPARRPRPPPPSSLVGLGALLMQQLQQWVVMMATSVTRSPGVLLKTLAFVIAILMALGRQDVRLRLIWMIRAAWEKVRRTVGMGVKVSYI